MSKKKEVNLGGRPTKYTDEMIDKVYEYLDMGYFSLDKIEKMQRKLLEQGIDFDGTGKGIAPLVAMNEVCVVPSIEGFARYAGVAVSTVYLWKQDPDKVRFSEALDEILDKQKELLINNGLKGSFNSNIAKLMLVNHGIHDKQELTVNNTDEEGITPEEKDERLARAIVFQLTKVAEQMDEDE